MELRNASSWLRFCSSARSASDLATLSLICSSSHRHAGSCAGYLCGCNTARMTRAKVEAVVISVVISLLSYLLSRHGAVLSIALLQMLHTHKHGCDHISWPLLALLAARLSNTMYSAFTASVHAHVLVVTCLAKYCFCWSPHVTRLLATRLWEISERSCRALTT